VHDGAVTDEMRPIQPSPTQRDAIARAKGVPGGTITGGEDPDLEETLERERPWIRLLVAMVIVLVLAGFVLGAIAAALGGVVGP
jgi:hypothetical protein